MTDHVHVWRRATPIDYLSAFGGVCCHGMVDGVVECATASFIVCSSCLYARCARHAAEVLDIPPHDRDERYQYERRRVWVDVCNCWQWRGDDLSQEWADSIDHAREVRGFHIASKAGSI